MERMSGFDAQFIYDERPEEPQHTLKVAILGPEAGAACKDAGLSSFTEWLASRLPAIPPLRWRAVRVPLDLHHPVWIEDPDLRLDRHVRRLALPSPGGHRELCEVLSMLLGQPLDPDHPLWEICVIEGLEGGRVALALKMSHALADGGASRLILERLFPPDGTTPQADAAVPESLPAPGRLAWDALRDGTVALGTQLPRMLLALSRALVRTSSKRIARVEPPNRPPLTLLRNPWTPFGGPLSRRRAFDYTTVPLGETRAIAHALGFTIGDVVLATAAGGVRRYLLEHGALPGLPTLGHIAISTREPGETPWGNRVSSRVVALPTQVADPIERLRAAAAAAQRAKQVEALVGPARLAEWQRRAPPFFDKVIALAGRSLARLGGGVRGGVVVSNVRGPARPLQSPWGPVDELVSVGHMKYTAGLNTTVWSYCDHLNFAFYACAEAVPDLERLGRHVGEAFEELRKASGREAGRMDAADRVDVASSESGAAS